MLDDATIAALAAELHVAQRRRVQVRHLSLRHPGMTIDDGYAIQRTWLKTRLAEGRVVKGRKIGPTSRAMQQASQIDEPEFAPLLDDMFFAAGAIPFDRFIAPRVEVELAFVLAGPLRGPHVTLADMLDATEHVTPAVEIIDARIEQFDPDTKAPRKVFDDRRRRRQRRHRRRGRPIAPRAIDLRWAARCSTRTVSSKRRVWPQAFWITPGNGVLWLANRSRGTANN